MCACVRVSECARERERDIECACVGVCAHVCVRERENVCVSIYSFDVWKKSPSSLFLLLDGQKPKTDQNLNIVLRLDNAGELRRQGFESRCCLEP